jgi:hypothetical protein
MSDGPYLQCQGGAEGYSRRGNKGLRMSLKLRWNGGAAIKEAKNTARPDQLIFGPKMSPSSSNIGPTPIPIHLRRTFRPSQSTTQTRQTTAPEPRLSRSHGRVRFLFPFPTPPNRRSTGVDRSTYYDSKKRMTASLIRARKPYLWKNFFMGMALSGIATGICARSRLGPGRG